MTFYQRFVNKKEPASLRVPPLKLCRRLYIPAYSYRRLDTANCFGWNRTTL